MSAELKKFQTSARAVMRKVAQYVQDGGDVLTSSKTERALHASRCAWGALGGDKP